MAMAMPAFMSKTPGPWSRPSDRTSGIRASRPDGRERLDRREQPVALGSAKITEAYNRAHVRCTDPRSHDQRRIRRDRRKSFALRVPRVLRWPFLLAIPWRAAAAAGRAPRAAAD